MEAERETALRKALIRADSNRIGELCAVDPEAKAFYDDWGTPLNDLFEAGTPPVEQSQVAYDAAAHRAKEADTREPRALAAAYDEGQDAFVLVLRGGITLVIPRKRIPGSMNEDSPLRGPIDGSNAALGRVEIAGEGEYLRWPDLDVDLEVPSLVADALGLYTSEDLDDYHLGTAALERVRRGEEETHTLEEAERDLGLAD